MENSHIDDTLDTVLETFRHTPTTPETGLDVDDPGLLQLRKACRLLDAAEFLEAENGYYTLVIEASFSVIERTLQYYLFEKGLIHDDDYVTHETVYKLGEQAGLYNNDVRDKLLRLWENNRSRTYYREGIGSQQRAALMTTLARSIHDHVLQLADQHHNCICRD